MTLVRGYEAEMEPWRCGRVLSGELSSIKPPMRCGRLADHKGPHTLTWAWGDHDCAAGEL